MRDASDPKDATLPPPLPLAGEQSLAPALRPGDQASRNVPAEPKW